VISACADQSELMKRFFGDDKPYPIVEGFGDVKNSKPFAEGTRKAMSHLIKPTSPLYDTFDKLVWDNNASIFGPVVCLLIFIISFLLFTIFHTSFLILLCSISKMHR